MGNLSNLYISQSYTSLAHLGTDNALVPGQMTVLQDGIGQSLNIFFDGTNISSSGNIYAANLTGSGGTINTGSLVTTSSFNSYTQSTNIRLNNLESTTASLNSSITQLNASSASQQVSINALNTFTASVSTASIVTSITELNSWSASAKVSISALNTYTASQSTASIVTSITNLNSFTSSANIRLNNLESKTGSYATTGSNVFIGTQTISAPANIALIATGSIQVNGGIVVSSGNSISTPRLTTNQIDSFTGNAQALSISSYGSGSINIDSQGNGTYFYDSVNISGFLTASLQQGYVWVGDGTGKTKTVATSSFGSYINTGSFMTTGSVNVNVLTFTKADGTTFSLTVAASGSVTPGTISGSAQITALGFVSSSVTASSLITASFDNGTRNLTFTKGDASTFSVNIPDVSGSTFNTGSLVTTASFNAYTQSNDQRVSSLETNSSSVNTSLTNLNLATASLYTSASLSLINASVSGQLLSFTKGNNSTFTVTLPSGSQSIVTGSYGAFQDSTTQSGSANTAYKFKFNQTDISDGVILSGSTGLRVGAYGTYNLEWSGQLVQGSGAAIVSVWVNVNGIQVSGSRGDVTLSSNTKLLPAWNYFLTLNPLDVVELNWASDSGNTTWQALPTGTTPITPSAASIIATLARVDVGGGSNSISTGSFNAYTASNDQKVNSLINSTGSYATTGSNTFIGNQTITGSVIISSSATYDLIVKDSMVVSGSNGGTYLSTSGFRTSNTGTNIGSYVNQFQIAQVDTVTSDEFGFTLDGNTYGVSGWSGPTIYGNDTADLYPAFFGFQNKSTWTDGTIAVLTPLSASAGFTASLQNGYAWVGNSLGQNKQVPTSSFGGGGAAFPYTGDAVITGSLLVSGSTIPDVRVIGNIAITGSIYGQPITLTVASSTASMDMRASNSFILNIPTGSTTHIVPTNIIAGQTINLLLKQAAGATTGSVAWSPIILFPSGYDLVATATGSAIDLVSMISFDTTNLMAANVKNLK